MGMCILNKCIINERVSVFDGEPDYHIPSSFRFIIMYLDMSTVDVRHFYISACIKPTYRCDSFRMMLRYKNKLFYFFPSYIDH